MRLSIIALLLAWPLTVAVGWVLSDSVRTHVPNAMLPLCWIFAFGLFVRQCRYDSR
ncbi:MAG TPA: hypothetical protein VGB55_14470 [Tepidisphaeraceae bacterium]